jgi:hypothetical protein
MLSRTSLLTRPGLRNLTTSAIRRATSAEDHHKSDRAEGLQALRRGAKKDPELYVSLMK